MEAMSSLEKGFSRATADLQTRCQRRKGIDMVHKSPRKNG
jgi:hypothetical protein